MVGIEVVHVPYKGSGAAVTAVMTGEVTFIFKHAIEQLGHEASYFITNPRPI